MSGWDVTAVSSSDQRLRVEDNDGQREDGDGEQSQLSITQAQSKFRQFLRQFRVEEQFVYRDQLLANWNQGVYFVVVDTEDVGKVLFIVLRPFGVCLG